MSVREYVGARYVPIVVGEWDNTRTYEPLMVVTYQGNSYTSRQYVPTGIEITNESYWVLSANYNAQVEAYRQEVAAFDSRITNNTTNIANETTARQNADTAINNTLNAIAPLDTAPTNGSTKGATSGGIYSAIDTNGKNAMLLNGKTAVVFGDSTAANTPSYFTQLATKTGMSVTNRAISGTALTPRGVGAWSAVTSTGNDGYNLITRQTDLANFDIVFLAYSTNDWQSSQKVKNAGMEDNNYVSFAAALQKVIDYIQEQNPDALIVFVAPAYAYRKWDGTTANCNTKGYTLRDYAVMAEKIMYENHMGFIDLGNVGVNYSNYTNWLLDDSGGIFVHYNANLKTHIVDYIIGSYPWEPRRIASPMAKNVSTYQATYIESLSICSPLTATDTADSTKTICYGGYKATDNSYIGNCNAYLTSGSNTVALTDPINFSDGFDGLIYLVTLSGEAVVITAENTDFQLTTQASEFDLSWLAIHVPPTNAIGRIIMTRADTSKTNNIVATCVCEADNITCMPEQLRHYNLSSLVNSDNLTVTNQRFGITDTVHVLGTVNNTGVGFVISSACAALANNPAFNNPQYFTKNYYANGLKALAFSLDSAGGLTLFLSSAVGASWNISI